MGLLPKEQSDRVKAILSEREATAQGMMSHEYITIEKDMKVGEILEKIRNSQMDPGHISYIYIVNGDGKTLLGVVDVRELLLSRDDMTVGEIMASPVVTAEANDVQDDLAEMFAKYHYRMIPVVDDHDSILGVIRYNDIMKGVETRVKI
jgi:magnesium transporter